MINFDCLYNLKPHCEIIIYDNKTINFLLSYFILLISGKYF